MLLVTQRLDTPRMEPLLPGSTKRKLAVDEGPRLPNGVSSGPMTQGSSKRPCLDDVTLAMGPGLQHSPFSLGAGAGPHGPLLEGNGLNHNGLGSPYSVPPKASPDSMVGGTMQNSFNPGGASTTPTVEQELQDLLEELTKNPDPSLTELDIEKILGNKGDEQGGGSGGFVHPEGAGTPKGSPQGPSHLETHLTRSPGFSTVPPVGSSQVGPHPTGGAYSLSHTVKVVPSPLSASSLSASSSQSHTQGQARSPMLSAALSSRPGSTWHEVSRAQQLQQMASNSKLLSSGAGPSSSQPAPSLPVPQAAPWAGPSPPYRPGEKLASSSPHQPPFSPVGSTQSPQGSLMSGLGPTPPKGPSPPYRPEKLSSPALAQPPFSPQSIQNSSAPVLPGALASSGNARPSPPYRPDKRPSPVLQHQGPPSAPPTHFSSQGESASASSQLFKAMTQNQSSSLKLLMQQQQQPVQSPMQPQTQPPPAVQQVLGKVGMAQDPYSFTNTKPLRHFDPILPAQNISPLTPGQASLSHYPSSSVQPAVPAMASGQAQMLQQQEMQQCMPRGMQAGGMIPGSRADPSSAMVSRPQDAVSVTRSAPGSFNPMLKNQIIRKHLLQETQRHMEQMNGKQVPECHQVVPFQGTGRLLPPECNYPVVPPSADPPMMPHGPVVPGRIGIPQGSHGHVGRPGGPFMGNSGPKQPLCHPTQASEFGVLLRPGQGFTGAGLQTRPVVHQAAARAGMPVPVFSSASLQPPQPQHLRHALQQGGATPRMVFSPQHPPPPQMPVWQQQGPPRLTCDTHMDPGLQQQAFTGGGGRLSQFAQSPVRTGMPGNFAPPQTGPPPNQVAPGFPSRQMQKIQTGHPISSVGPPGLRPRGPLLATAGMTPVTPGMVHAAQSITPSYPSPSSKHTPEAAYSGRNPEHKLTPYEYSHQQNNGLIPEAPAGGSAEVDFIDTLVGSNEDWLNNLSMIDEYLEQNS
ncbi:mastermind-like protein 2 [Brienomyrus brachyistius]|uniref:mastermind-like protein 2 n=1 Tax=Brienomyrus brachyistius TaxID=42636 RepID=UPI0020B44401|nr:mastermind-like protein 2 [Brienomyrus brachyistius]